MEPSKNKKSTMAEDSMFTPFNLICYIGLAIVVANVADLTLSWFQRQDKAKKAKSAKGKDAENELDEILCIIEKRGKPAKHKKELELAKELRSAKGKDAKTENELDKIHCIIDRKGEAAKHMTVLELAKELRDFGGVWSELLNSRHE